MTARRDRLARRRAARGHSQEELAELLGVAASTVVRWESGSTAPRPHQRPRLAALLGVALPDLDVLLGAVTVVTPEVTPAASVLGEPDAMRRRDLLGLLAATGTLIALPEPLAAAAVRPGTGSLLETGQRMLGHLWQVYALADSKADVYPVIRQQLHLLSRGLDTVRGGEDRKALCAQAGNLYQLAGEVCFDARDYLMSAHCYALAVNASREATDFDLWACALTRHAYVELYADRPAAAAPLLSAASRAAQRGADGLPTRFWVSAVQAQVYAALGEFDSCARALDDAEGVRAIGGEGPGGWLRFTGSRLGEERGACYVALGRPDLAEEALVSALNQELSARRRGAVLADLATLGAQRGDVDQVVHYAEKALTVAGLTHSGYVGAKLEGGLGPRLAPFLSDVRVSDLREKIAALSGAA